MHNNPREATDKILDLIDEGILDKDYVILACLKFMPENEVAEMARLNEFFIAEEEEEAHKDCTDVTSWYGNYFIQS